jgi:hypothetical protein
MDDIEDEDVVVCASPPPNMIKPRIAAATSVDLANDIVAAP